MVKRITWFLLICFISMSCKTDNEKNKILLESNNLSNKFYEKEISQLRTYFENKSIEQPNAFKEDYDKIKIIEKSIIVINGLKTVSDKKGGIRKLKKKVQELIEINTLTFGCLKINEKDEFLFDSVLENDCNRILYRVYKEFYRLNYAVF
ncbi:conserved hypothetical protein [Tenacibaculum sp. 190524A05c]